MLVKQQQQQQQQSFWIMMTEARITLCTAGSVDVAQTTAATTTKLPFLWIIMTEARITLCTAGIVDVGHSPAVTSVHQCTAVAAREVSTN